MGYCISFFRLSRKIGVTKTTANSHNIQCLSIEMFDTNGNRSSQSMHWIDHSLNGMNVFIIYYAYEMLYRVS